MSRSIIGLALGLTLLLSLSAAAADPEDTDQAEQPGVLNESDSVDSDGDGLLDSFEEQWGITRADQADTDNDGLSDSAEDDDDDRLSALGEQRFNTNPADPDSDADGVSDGDEDADGDGISDAEQQDQRPVPGTLAPAPDQAWWDRPVSYDQGCHGGIFDPELYPCTFGDPDSQRTVAIFGDSHALQWLPALIGAGEADGWEVVTLTKSACPAVDVIFERAPKYDGADATCTQWRQRALDWMAENTPDVVVLSSAGRHYKLLDRKSQPVPDDARTARWQQGLTRTLRAIPDETTAIVLADTPRLKSNPASCLPEHPRDISACQTPRRAALDPKLDAAERTTAEAEGALFDSLNDLVCSYDPCPVVIEDVMMWRNHAHITATFAELLAPAMGEILARASADG